MADNNPVSFNVNLFVPGILIAAVISALGFSDGDPVVQWYVPAGILFASLGLAVLWPEKKKDRDRPV